MRPDSAFSALVTKVDRVGSYAGAVHCPGCGWRIGRAESPAIGYVRDCPQCNAPLEIQVEIDAVTITLRRGHG